MTTPCFVGIDVSKDHLDVHLRPQAEAFRLALSRSDVVIATGSLGPTQDDVTRDAIAQALGISHRTVHHHNQSIFGKLGASTRGAAALFAIENDLT